METAEIRRRFLALLREQRPHGRAQSPRCCSTTRTCCSSTPAWCRSCPTSSARRPPPWKRATSVQKCVRTRDIEEVGKTTPARHVLPDERQLLLRRLLQGRRDPARLGAGHRRPGRGRLRPRRRADLGRRSTSTTTRPSQLWMELTGLPAERIVRRGHGRQLLVDGRPRARAARAASSSTTAARSTAREGGPAVDEDRYMEFWNLVFMQNDLRRGAAPRRTSTILGDAADQEHRHRHGPGADRLAAPGRRQPLRDRRGPPGPRARRRADRQALRRPLRARRGAQPPRRRPAARRRRPRAHLADAHRRRRHPRQRGPRLRAAPDAAPRGPLDAAARRTTSRACPSCCR